MAMPHDVRGLYFNLGHGASLLRNPKAISFSYHFHRQAQTVLSQYGTGMLKMDLWILELVS